MLQNFARRVRRLVLQPSLVEVVLYKYFRRPYVSAPFSLNIYESFLLEIYAHKSLRFVRYSSPGNATGGVGTIRVRHDLDTKQCLRNSHLLFDVNDKLSVVPGVYVRMDGVEYSPSSCKEVVDDALRRGFDVGLHTSCYRQHDYWSEFSRETSLFEDVLGFSPRSFTVHGMGTLFRSIRDVFESEVQRLMPLDNYTFTDSGGYSVAYDYSFQDCHLEKKELRRFLLDDFRFLPRFFLRNRNFLILTHPCYWTREK